MSETSGFEQFKEIFDAYFAKWWKVIGVLFVLAYLVAFGLYTIAICDKHLDLALPSFLRAIVTFEYWSWMNDTVVDAIGIGFIAVGALTVGVVFYRCMFRRRDCYGCFLCRYRCDRRVFCWYRCVWRQFVWDHRHRGRHPSWVRGRSKGTVRHR